MGAAGIVVQAKVEPADLAALFTAAKAAPGTMQVELRRGIVKAADAVAVGVRQAASFSTRIPGAVKVKASFARGGASVVVVVDGKAAPEAAALNNHDQAGQFRHPVWAHGEERSRWTWVDETARPFLGPGAQHGVPTADRQMLQVMDHVAQKLGFR